MYHILVCDDEKDIVNALQIYLNSEGYRVFAAYNGEEALHILQHEEIHLVLMDIMMPKMDGITAMTRLRTFSNVPVLLLTAKSEDTDKILGLNVGADDYIAKPFSIREVVARVKAVLRRAGEKSGGQQILKFHGLEVNLDKKTVSIDGEDIPFSKTEFELLALLLRERGHVFSRQELINRIWPKDVLVLDRTVDVNITRMRKKIKDYAHHIVTRLGYGYFFEE